MGLAEPPEHPHRPSPNLPFVADPRRWEQVDDYFVFTIARNPYIRVLSAYLDKIRNHRDINVWSRFAAQHDVGDSTLEFHELSIVAATPEAGWTRTGVPRHPQSNTQCYSLRFHR